jgi:hypothetical protein
VPERLQDLDEVLLQRKARMIGADRDSHVWNYSFTSQEVVGP